MVSQFLGAFVGALFCAIINAGFKNDGTVRQRATLSLDSGDYYIQTIISEITGSFLMVFMYLCSTEEKTKFTKDSVV